MAILPKIKAKWPNAGIDLLTGWDAVWQALAREGWAEPVTVENCPNIADIPKKLLIRDAAGSVINIPRTVTSMFWFYRQDTTPFEITNIDDLLNPALKGKVCFALPSLNSNPQMVSLALHKGGDEKNMEPAWYFMKKLARSGNIGRVANADTDIAASISSGETCVSLQGGTSPFKLGQTFKIRFLNTMERQTGFRSFVYSEGWCVLKGGRTQAAFNSRTFAINPENNADFNRAIGAIPANVKSKVSDENHALRIR
ncbi:extracellular solute-binding protein [Bradyrhizobium sp. 179]|uniref:extracellular solute-binding protein n=1 Tax=Bradyrhizobium sp. 179 TaxID=2782648 RepID=UPI001FF8B840|nr:extracellular solute-binding protein [Bradyrhizobium sp. 179]MCK1544304.1 extracellular solute-binding protein [Bradyrhizobium sp. 179]